MKLTKYEHACFALEKDGKLLIVDPGAWTTDLPALDSVVAVVITHEHHDHFDVNALGAIIGRNPEAVIYAHENITKQFGDTLPHQAVIAGETIKAGPFTTEFFGGQHATIHSSFDTVANLGVMINDSLYYPGDSFDTPDRAVKVLALPVAAPWMKIAEAMEFCSEVKADLVFPTHDAIASNAGKQLSDNMIPGFVQSYGGTYKRITDPIEIDG